MRAIAALAAALLANSCSNPKLSLERACRDGAGIEVVDHAAYRVFLDKVQAIDLAEQQGQIRRRNLGLRKAPPDTNRFIPPFPYVPGYETIYDHDGAYGQPRPSRTPRRNNKTITQSGKPVVVVSNFQVAWNGFTHEESADCIIEFPDLYQIKRATILDTPLSRP